MLDEGLEPPFDRVLVAPFSATVRTPHADDAAGSGARVCGDVGRRERRVESVPAVSNALSRGRLGVRRRRSATRGLSCKAEGVMSQARDPRLQAEPEDVLPSQLQ